MALKYNQYTVTQTCLSVQERSKKATRASWLECVAFVLSFHFSTQPSPHCNLVVLLHARLPFGVKHVLNCQDALGTHHVRDCQVTKSPKEKKTCLLNDNHVCKYVRHKYKLLVYNSQTIYLFNLILYTP